MFGNLENLKDGRFLRHLKRALQETGEPPEFIPLNLKIPFEVYKTFLKRFEGVSIKTVGGETLRKEDVLIQLAWLWGAKMAGLEGNIFNAAVEWTKEVPKRYKAGRPRTRPPKPAKEKNPEEKRGRPRKHPLGQTVLFKSKDLKPKGKEQVEE